MSKNYTNHDKGLKCSTSIHIPCVIFTAATTALTILHHTGMAIYFAVLTFLALVGETTIRDDKKE